VFGFTYTELSASLIKAWSLPETIYQPISMMNKTETPSSDVETCILQLSYVLALDNVNPEIYPSYNNLEPHLPQQLALDDNDLEDALDITNLQCVSVISLFNPSAFMLY